MNRVTVLVCALAVACLSGCGHLPSSAALDIPGESYASRRGVSELRVMSFNLRVKTVADMGNHWNLRRGLVLETIREFNPDVLGTQEGVASQTAWLRKNLPGYAFVGVGRNNGKRGGEMCGVFYNADKFRKLDEGHFWLSENPEKAGSKGWGAWFPRMVTWVKLEPRRGGDEFYCFNTHLDAFSETARVEGSKLLRQRIERIAAGSAVVVTGDFNTGEGTEPYRVLTAGRGGRWGVGLQDTYRAAEPIARSNEGTRHGFRGNDSDERIDWILASSDFQTIDADINQNRGGLGRYPSDHFPVTATLRWNTAYVAGRSSTIGG